MFLQRLVFVSSALLAASLATASKSEGIHKFWIDKTYENTSKVKNYRALVEQNHPDGVITTAVQFRQPADFYMQVEQPLDFKGVTFSYQNGQLQYYSPQSNQALLVKGLAGPSADSAKVQAEDMYWANHEYYQRTFTPSIEVASRISVGVDLNAEDNEREIQKSQLFIDYDYSLLMKGDFYFRDGSVLSMENKKIDFNLNDFSLPDAQLPATTQLRSWNLSTHALNADQFKKSAVFTPAWPKVESERWKLAEPGYFFSDQGKDGAAVYYKNSHYFLLMTAEQASPMAATPAGARVKLDNNLDGQLLQAPSISSVELQRDGIHYQLLSNIHLEDLLLLARQLSN
ncbi:hypothetical protein [Bacterioplanoides sp.]|uniref:hypothetical protein n=1 Tax=Bacterioplanoides sp. TaxID=2066072 RepID=UPI003B5B7806